MGTRSNPRHRRRSSKRGLASFISFFLLFAFALGQSTLSALADEARTTAVAAPAAPPGPDTPGAPSGNGVQPILLTGNQNCAQVLGDQLLFEYRDDPPQSHTVDLSAESDGDVEGTLEITVHGSTFDFEITDGDPVWAVVVKGGSNANLFDYRLAGEDADTLLHAPVNPQNGQFYGLSHISFCWGEQIAVPGIDVAKSCPAEVPFGQDIEYTITVTNTGNEPLIGVNVKDTLLGDITDAFDFDFSNPFPVGEVATAVVTYTPQPGDPDPITNTVHVHGFGQSAGGTKVTDTTSCTTDITHEPGIDVTKSCPESVPFGEDVTFTITVENTGAEALENVQVTDALLGGDITGDFNFPDPFPVGGEVSAEFNYTPGVGEDPVENSVTASGDGVNSGVEASDEASCTTDVVNPNPAISVEKSCIALAHEGDTVTYTITVTNTGDEDLDGVTVTDTILGDLSAFFADELSVGASESHDFDYVILESDPDPLLNEVTVKGSGVDSQVEVEALADCATDVIHPGIEIVKTVDEETVPIGTTVTYTYVITNTGDTTLYEISVDDDILGHIGDIAVLEPGQSVTLTKDFVVGDEPVTNVGTAEGEDILGRSVSSLDDATVTPIADVNPSDDDPPTPFTGSDAGRLGLISMVLFGIGVTVVATTRRRRPEREAA